MGLSNEMGFRRNMGRRFASVTSALAFTVSMASVMGVYAAPAYASEPSQKVSVSAGPLDVAILDLAKQTGLSVFVTPSITDGKKSSGLSGTMLPERALARLLQGSGLAFKRENDGSYVVIKAAFASEPVVKKSGAAAQQTPRPPSPTSIVGDDGGMGNDEIVVTAQRRTQRLQDIPVSASVASGETLAQDNIVSLESLVSRLPSVRIAPAPVSDFIAIRGVGSSLNLAFEQSVGTFVDGIYRGRSRSTRAALFDVERVEVLKGPQTTFFGNNAIAGAFNITTRKPGDVLEANASAFYAPNTDEYTIEAGVSVPVTEGFAIRAAGRFSGMNGYTHNDNLGTMEPHLRERVARLSAVMKPTDFIETALRLDVGRSRNRGIFSNQISYCPPDASIFGGPTGVCARYLAASGGEVDDKLDRRSAANSSFFRYDFLEAEHTTTLDFGLNSLILTTGYFDHDYDLLNDVNPVPAALGGSVVGTSQTIPALFVENFKQFSQEVRFQSNSNDNVEYMLGGYYSNSTLNIDGHQGLYFAPFWNILGADYYSSPTPIAIHVFNHEKAKTWSFFGSSTVHVTPDLRVNVGARYSIVEKNARRIADAGSAASIPTAESYIAGPPGFQAVALPALGVDSGDFDQNKRSDKKFIPSISIQYDLAPDVMAYASYTKGFKAGGFSAYISKSIFGPETVDAFEAGLRTRLFDRRLTFNLTGFWSDYKDLQETTTVFLENGSQVQVVDNIAQSRSKGIEASANLIVAAGLSLSADLTYLDARYRNYQNAPCTILQGLSQSPCSQDLSGKRRAFAPEFSGNIGIDYEADIAGSLQARFGGRVFMTSRYFMQPLADRYLSQPGYASFDARIAIGPPDRKWEAAVIGKNLTDKRTGSFRQPVPTTTGSFMTIADPPRSIGFQFSVRY